MTGLCSRRTPCASCPYRLDAPSGVWHETEYAKLPRWDGDMIEQANAGALGLFLCHQTGEELCAGWVGHRDEPTDLLAIRIGITRSEIDPSVAHYASPVPLHPTGRAAADHGMRDHAAPGDDAQRHMDRLVRKGRAS